MKDFLTSKIPLYWLLAVVLAAVLGIAVMLSVLAPTEPPVQPIPAPPAEPAVQPSATSLPEPTDTADKSITALFDGDFVALAQSGKGVYYDWRNNRLFGAEQVDRFIAAVKNKAAGGFIYLADSAYEPFICDFSVKAGDGFYSVTLYRPDGSMETLQSQNTNKDETYYRFGRDVLADYFPLYIPFGIDDPARQKVMEDYRDRYIEVLKGPGLLVDAWNSPATINPERLMGYYLRSYILPRQSLSDADTVEIEGAKLEAEILEHFDMPVRRIRAADNYNEVNQTYSFTGGIGSGGSSNVTNYTQEGDVLTLECDFYGMSDMTTVKMKCRLKVQVQGDDYKFLSNGCWLPED